MTSPTLFMAGRYRLSERIAAGGVGEVWRGHDAVLGRAVAVKLLRAEYSEHPETLARFRAEARHAAGVSHPGIAQVYDYGEDGQPFLIMELVDGPSLAAMLADGPLDVRAAMDVVAQTAAALDAAHAAGLVHRDIKPANLLLGPGGQVKITDFGIAHAAGSAPLTRTGTLVGTPAYLAPERVVGKPATAASDLYSLGIVCYECLTGERPFTGTSVEIALAHQHGRLPPLPPHVPPQAAALVASLTARDPAARPASAAAAASQAALARDALAGSGTGGPGGSPAEQPTILGEPLPATIAGPLLSAADTWQGSGPVPAPGPGQRDYSRRGWILLPAAGALAIVAALAGWLVAGGPGPSRPQHHRPATASSPRFADVNAAQLAGQPVATARRELRHLGLRVHVSWQHHGHQVTPDAHDGQPVGTVISVAPSGHLRAGTTVVVVAELGHPDHGNGNGNGDGHGHGNGNGNGNGDNGDGG
jgi:eukaryotic-like serine/threonine-protein kinase